MLALAGLVAADQRPVGEPIALTKPEPKGSVQEAAALLRRQLLDKDPRIVGGAEVSPAFSFPWLGSLQTAYGHICGGSVVDKEHFLTAAHCIEGGALASSYSVMFYGHSQSSTVTLLGSGVGKVRRAHL